MNENINNNDPVTIEVGNDGITGDGRYDDVKMRSLLSMNNNNNEHYISISIFTSLTDSSGGHPVETTCLTDIPVDHKLRQDGVETFGANASVFYQSQIIYDMVKEEHQFNYECLFCDSFDIGFKHIKT